MLRNIKGKREKFVLNNVRVCAHVYNMCTDPKLISTAIEHVMEACTVCLYFENMLTVEPGLLLLRWFGIIQGVETYDLPANSGLLSVFTNKALLGHSRSHLITSGLCITPSAIDSCDRDHKASPGTNHGHSWEIQGKDVRLVGPSIFPAPHHVRSLKGGSWEESWVLRGSREAHLCC